MMLDGAAAPEIGRDIFRRRRQAKLRRRIVGPQRAALGAQRTVQRVTPVGASLTSNCVWPQWQLPLIGTIGSFPNDPV